MNNDGFMDENEDDYFDYLVDLEDNQKNTQYITVQSPFKFPKILNCECKSDTREPFGIEGIEHEAEGKYYYANHFERTISNTSPNIPPNYGFYDFMPGWSRFVVYDDDMRRILYYHHRSNTYQWHNPRLLHSDLVRFSLNSLGLFPLSEQIEVKIMQIVQNGTPRLVPLFVNHRLRTTSFIDPRETEWKQAQLKSYFKQNCQRGLHVMFVRESNLLLDTIETVLSMSPIDLNNEALKVVPESFVGVMDAGGVKTALFNKVMNELLNERLGMFIEKPDGIRINPVASEVATCLKYYYFLGRFIGLIMRNDRTVEAEFNKIFFMYLMGRDNELTKETIAHYDPDIADRFQQIDQLAPEDIELAMLSFGESYATGGKVYSFFFIPPQQFEETDVNASNVNEYITYFTEFAIKVGPGKPLKAMVNGLKDVFPIEWLRIFQIDELKSVMCGESLIDVEDWKANTLKESSLANRADTDRIWNDFWVCLGELQEGEKQAFLRYSTGRKRPPFGGFANFPSTAKYRLQITQAVNFSIKAQTCFNCVLVNADVINNREDMKQLLMDAISDEQRNAELNFNMA